MGTLIPALPASEDCCEKAKEKMSVAVFGGKHRAGVLCSVCIALLLLVMLLLLLLIILGTLTSVPVSVVNFTYMILMNAQNKQMSRDYDSPFLQVEKMKSFA